MAEYYRELLSAGERLIARRAGQKGRLPSARLRRGISTSYYALFHFLAEECGYQIIGTGQIHLRRRRLFARIFSHRGLLLSLEKVRGHKVHASVQEFFRFGSDALATVDVPPFAQTMARVFIQAQDLRQQADYDLNANLSVLDAQEIMSDVDGAIGTWMAATGPDDKQFKKALCVLMVLGGKLRGHDG